MTLHLYFARRFATAFGTVFGLFLILLTMLDLVDQIRRFDDENITFSQAFTLALLSMPNMLYTILPLIVILATLMLYLGLARTSELVVTRAAGRSGIRALVAPVLTAAALGIFAVAVLNPIVAATQAEYEVRANALRNEGTQIVSVSREGLWLREGGPSGQRVIRAQATNLDGTVFSGVTFLTLTPEGEPIQRIEAQRAALMPGSWQIDGAKVWQILGEENPERTARAFDRMEIASSLTQDQIRDSFGTPSAIPIWELPGFIKKLDRAGFSARLHRVWFHMQLALPVFLAAMVLIGAGFTMRHTRLGRTGMMVLFALLLGLAVYFIRNFAQILGENGQIPIVVAAWSPPVAAILLSLGLLLHLEDG